MLFHDARALLLMLYVPCSLQYDLSEPQLITNTHDTCFARFGRLACWGYNSEGQLGRGNTVDVGSSAEDIAFVLLPIDLGDDFVVKQVAGGSYGTFSINSHSESSAVLSLAAHHCAVSVDARLRCWGFNEHGTFSTPN